MNQYRTYVLGNGEWAIVNTETMTIEASSAMFPTERFAEDIRENGREAHPSFCTSESVFERFVTGTLEEATQMTQADAGAVRGISYCVGFYEVEGMAPAVEVHRLNMAQITDRGDIVAQRIETLFDISLTCEPDGTLRVGAFSEALDPLRGMYERVEEANPNEWLLWWDELTSIPTRRRVDASEQGPASTWLVAFVHTQTGAVGINEHGLYGRRFTYSGPHASYLTDNDYMRSHVCLRFSDDGQTVAVIDMAQAVAEIDAWEKAHA